MFQRISEIRINQCMAEKGFGRMQAINHLRMWDAARAKARQNVRIPG